MGTKVYWSSCWPTEYKWALNCSKWMKETKGLNGVQRWAKNRPRHFLQGAFAFSFPDRGKRWRKEVNRLCFVAAREVWWQPWPLSDKQLWKHPLGWGIELWNRNNRRKALRWGQQRGENTFLHEKDTRDGGMRCFWPVVSVFPICRGGGSIRARMHNLARSFRQHYVLSNWVKTCWFRLRAQPSAGFMNADDCDCSSVERSQGNVRSLNRGHLLQANLSPATSDDAHITAFFFFFLI